MGEASSSRVLGDLRAITVSQAIPVSRIEQLIVLLLAATLSCNGANEPDPQQIAERFTPIIYYDSREPNLPTNVDDFLTHTALCYYDLKCRPPLNEELILHPSQQDLLGRSHPASCGSNGHAVSCSGTLSDDKRTTFYLKDVDFEFRGGSRNSSAWPTYFHYYRSRNGGAVIQYWRFYAYNTGETVSGVAAKDFPDLWTQIPQWIRHSIGSGMAGFHGGDWEGIQIILDGNLQASDVWLLGHTSILKIPWSEMPKVGTHAKVKSELGGHTSSPFVDADEATFIRQECWSDGAVTGRREGYTLSRTGPLVNLGQKIAPLNRQLFLAYSGLWGSPSQGFARVSQIPFAPTAVKDTLASLADRLYFFSSGYWGPAYNETEKASDDFITSWAHDAVDPEPAAGGLKEWHPINRLPR